MNKIRAFFALTLNVIIDYINYLIHSGLVFQNNEEKLKSIITYNYHTIEKGLSMPDIRLGFGQEKIAILKKNILLYISKGYNIESSQFIAGCTVLIKYYLLHEESNFNISYFFKHSDFLIFKRYSDIQIGGSLIIDGKEYFKESKSDYQFFFKSRHSVRYFNSIPVTRDKIINAINLAKYCPSACNRQSSKVYLIENKHIINKILKIQKGINSTSDHIYQLLVLTSNRNYFFTSGERNQHFIDGGIFLNSILLALHFENIAACPLHWSLNFKADIEIRKMIHSTKGEKVIALIAIGNIVDKFKVPASQRKDIEEIFSIIE